MLLVVKWQRNIEHVAASRVQCGGHYPVKLVVFADAGRTNIVMQITVKIKQLRFLDEICIQGYSSTSEARLNKSYFKDKCIY